MRLQDKKAYGHGRIPLLQQRMVAREHLCQHDLVAIALPHFFPIESDHVVMEPITCRNMLVADSALRDLTLMMGELKVHPTPMDVELTTQIFGAHGRAFYMP